MSNELSSFFKAVGKRDLLTKAQEVELAQRIEKGDMSSEKPHDRSKSSTSH